MVGLEKVTNVKMISIKTTVMKFRTGHQKTEVYGEKAQERKCQKPAVHQTTKERPIKGHKNPKLASCV